MRRAAIALSMAAVFGRCVAQDGLPERPDAPTGELAALQVPGAGGAEPEYGYVVNFGDYDPVLLTAGIHGCDNGYGVVNPSLVTGFCNVLDNTATEFAVTARTAVEMTVSRRIYNGTRCAPENLIATQSGTFAQAAEKTVDGTHYFEGYRFALPAFPPQTYALREFQDCNDPTGRVTVTELELTASSVRMFHPTVEVVALDGAEVIDEELACGTPLDDSFAKYAIYIDGSLYWYSAFSNPSHCSTIREGSVESSQQISMRAQCNLTSREPEPFWVEFFEEGGCAEANRMQVDSFPSALQKELGGCNFYSAVDRQGNRRYFRMRCLYNSSLAGPLADSAGFQPTPPPFGEDEKIYFSFGEPNGFEPGLVVAVIPMMMLFAAIVFVFLSKRDDKDEEDAEEDLEDQLPEGSKVTRAGRLRMLGMSLAVMRVTTPEEGDGNQDHKKNKKASSRKSRKTKKPKEEKDFVIKNVEKDLKYGDLTGRGGAARVYKGAYKGSPVAIKEYLGNRSPAGFQREIRNLQKLQHPNVIRLYGAAESRDRRILVMELAQGSLADVVQGRLPQEPTAVSLLQWAQQICSALAFVHSKNLIHFDVKPENLLFDDAWNIKLVDFGLSRDVQSVARAPSTNDQDGGTPSFTAPELLTGERDALDSKADVYSFGIVFWQMFHMGKEPHPADWTVIKILQQVSVHKYRPLIDENLPPMLRHVIESSWDHDPKNRPTMNENLHTIHEILGPRSVDIAENGSFSERPPLELGQDCYAFDMDKQKWLAGIQMIATNRENQTLTYLLEGFSTPFNQDNLIHT